MEDKCNRCDYDINNLWIAFILLIIIGFPALFCGYVFHSALTWRITPIYEGVLKYADTQTLEFEDGTIFTRINTPFLIENDTKTVYHNFRWKYDGVLYKGHTYQVVRQENAVLFFWWDKPSFWESEYTLKEVLEA